MIRSLGCHAKVAKMEQVGLMVDENVKVNSLDVQLALFLSFNAAR